MERKGNERTRGKEEERRGPTDKTKERSDGCNYNSVFLTQFIHAVDTQSFNSDLQQEEALPAVT